MRQDQAFELGVVGLLTTFRPTQGGGVNHVEIMSESCQNRVEIMSDKRWTESLWGVGQKVDRIMVGQMLMLGFDTPDLE